MVVQLRRFTQKSGGTMGRGVFGMAMQQIAGAEKVTDLVDYPLEGLDMRQHAMCYAGEAKPVNYDLYAISNHFGGLNGGHYTATCQNPIDKQWYNFNDGSVSTRNEDEVVCDSAYLLFYRKRDTQEKGEAEEKKQE